MGIYGDPRTFEWLESTRTFPPEGFIAAFGIRKSSASFCYAAWNLFHQRKGMGFSKTDVQEAIRNGTVSSGPVKRTKID